MGWPCQPASHSKKKRLHPYPILRNPGGGQAELSPKWLAGTLQQLSIDADVTIVSHQSAG
eukprot:3496809-Pyramimonas_sp.AAC.1